ncbi:hypothetical protein AVEN_50535-1 [Araneus ventricosus]|uniref:Uncharacterized protein n=1 Tax=Araneus ventricosus TaxID=182803 RepID=A0A4Y2AQB7_ARAVE|nr:hypothetical protein AVEN_50535-1 [Araneus ventricosus]
MWTYLVLFIAREGKSRRNCLDRVRAQYAIKDIPMFFPRDFLGPILDPVQSTYKNATFCGDEFRMAWNGMHIRINWCRLRGAASFRSKSSVPAGKKLVVNRCAD